MTQQAATDSLEIDLLQSAFRTFDHAATTLQESYQALAARVEQLDLELAASNEALRVNLQEKEEMRGHLAAILESLTTGVLVADERGVTVRCNRAAETLVGEPRSRLLGRPLASILGDCKLDGGGYPLAAPHGIPLSLSRAVLRNRSGQATGSIVLLHDISAVRRLEERLQRRDRLAAMGEVVGRIAHEIRNPLGSVELFASMLRKDLRDEPERRRYAEHISMAVQAMDRLLANLLVCTRPNCPRLQWHATEPLLREALTLAVHTTARANIDIHVHVDDAVSRIWCDASQMKQVLLNLILNAAQAMPDGGTLRVAVTADREGETGPSSIRITVSDTGSGIEPGIRSRLFDPFFTTREEGTGLGLAIVHAIVDGHRGRVEVDSAVGRGSTFAVVLPMGQREG
jgi:signal transduction histidine kinase